MEILSKCRKLGSQIFLLSRTVGRLRFTGVIELTFKIIFLAAGMALRHSATFCDICDNWIFRDIEMSQSGGFWKPISSASNNIMCMPIPCFFQSCLNTKVYSFEKWITTLIPDPGRPEYEHSAKCRKISQNVANVANVAECRNTLRVIILKRNGLRSSRPHVRSEWGLCCVAATACATPSRVLSLRNSRDDNVATFCDICHICHIFEHRNVANAATF